MMRFGVVALVLAVPLCAHAGPPKWSKPVGPGLELPAPELQPSEIKGLTIDCSAKRTVSLPTVSFGTLVPTRGDTELGGKAEVELEARLWHGPRDLHLRAELRISEQGGDTELRRTVDRRIAVSVPGGCQIASVSRSRDRIEYGSGGEHGSRKVYGSDLISEARCVADTDGDDFGRVGCSGVTFRTVVVQFERAEPSDCSQAQVWLPDLHFAPLSRSSGDGEMGGNPAYVEVTSRAEALSDGRVRVRAYAKIEEDGGDHSTYTDSNSRIVFDVDRDRPGCRVTGIDNATGSLGDRTASKDGHKVQRLGEGDGSATSGHIHSARCRTDTNGKDDGRLTCRVLRLPVMVKLAPR